MKKKVSGLVVLVFILLVGVYLLINRPDPPIETKFAQKIEEQGTKDVEQRNQGEVKIQILEPGDYVLLDNPTHVYQTFNNCGAATLSMILNGLGESVTQKDLGDKMRPYQHPEGDNDDKTIFTYELVDWAKRYGFESVARVNGDIELLKTFNANGILVVVKTWLNVNEDIGHFRIVRGFDEGRQVIIQDDSFDGKNKKISYFDFLSMWQPFNYAYMIAYTPDQVELVEAIIGKDLEEGADWQNALTRANKEAEHDPENIYPLFNMSTSYYQLGDYQASVDSFESVENRLPRRMMWYQIEPIQAYFELGNYDRVFAISDNIIENGNRAFSELYQIQGEIYLTRGDVDKARAQFELALTYNENFEAARVALELL